MTSTIRSAVGISSSAPPTRSKAPMTGSKVAPKTKATPSTTAMKKTTRPLNSWLAFRSYYSTAFKGLQQKEISGILTYLWQSDPFKAEWSILAEAYSRIRDAVGKDEAPLPAFIALNASLLGILSTDDYLKMINWEVSADNSDQVILRHSTNFGTSTYHQSTNTSVNDIIAHYVQYRYLADGAVDSHILETQPTISMATAAHTYSQERPEVDSQLADPGLRQASSFIGHGRQNWPWNIAPEESQPLPATKQLQGSAINQNFAGSRIQVAAARPGLLQQTSTEDETLNGDFTAATMLPSQNPVHFFKNTAFSLDGEFPYYNQFDPDSPTFTFDPFVGYEFNAFNMSDWVVDEYAS